MGFPVVIALLALGTWGVFATFRCLRRTHSGRVWWIAFAALTTIGLAAGSWLAFGFGYQVSPQMRYVSFPIPLAVFHLEDGRLVDFVTPPHVMYLGFLANIVAVVAASLLPLLLASMVFGKKQKIMS